MTRDELIEKVAIIIFHNEFKECDSNETADEILNSIFDALKEPTEQMQSAAEEYDWEANHDITFSECFVSMLNASPLAPKEG